MCVSFPPDITVDTQWRTVQEKYKEDSRFQAISGLERMKCFEEYMKELADKDREAKIAEREKQRKKEKKQRENFRVSYELRDVLRLPVYHL